MRFNLRGGGELELDEAALGALLKSADVRAAVTGAAHAIAADLAGSGRKVYVDAYTTDRAAAAVTMGGYGADDELLRGELSNAAVRAGLEFEPK